MLLSLCIRTSAPALMAIVRVVTNTFGTYAVMTSLRNAVITNIALIPKGSTQVSMKD